MYLQNEKTLQLMVDIAQMLNENSSAQLVLFKDYFSKSSDAMYIDKDTYNVTTIDNFIGATHTGYGVVSPQVVDYTGQEVSIMDKQLTVHTIEDKLLKECQNAGRYLILNHYTNTYVDVVMEQYKASIKATFDYSQYKLEDILEGNPSKIEVIPLASDVTYNITLEERYTDDPGCGIYSMVVSYTTMGI